MEQSPKGYGSRYALALTACDALANPLGRRANPLGYPLREQLTTRK